MRAADFEVRELLDCRSPLPSRIILTVLPLHMKTRKVVLITGASTGIGRALALVYAARGYAVAITARRQPLLEELAREIERLGGQALALGCDVTVAEQVRSAVATTQQHFGRIDCAILSAGISEPTKAAEFKAADFQQLLQTNLLGVAYGLEALIPVMRQQGGGQIAAVSSLAGDRGMPGSAGYCATKAGLNALFEGMRGPLRPYGIKLVTIAPGYVQTPMTARFGKMPFVMSAEEAAQKIVRGLEQGQPVIRFPWQASWFMRFMRSLPSGWFDALTARRRPLKLEDETGK